MKKFKNVIFIVLTLILFPTIHSYGAESYKIIAKHSGKCLDVVRSDTQNSANVLQYSCHGGDNQLWNIIPVGGGYYKIIAKHSGKCLDVARSDTQNSANVLQYSCHGGDNQLWLIVK